MQSSSNPAAFLVLQAEDSRTKVPGGFFSPLAGSNVGIDFKPTRWFPLVVPQCRPAAGNHDLTPVSFDLPKFSFPFVGTFNLFHRDGKLRAENFVS